MKPGIEPTLRDLGIRGDIIKIMHRAMSRADHEPDVSGLALHGDQAAEPVLGRLVERGLHDELKGTAYAIIEGVDGRTHHLIFSDLEVTGDARPGAIVETRAYDEREDVTRDGEDARMFMTTTRRPGYRDDSDRAARRPRPKVERPRRPAAPPKVLPVCPALFAARITSPTSVFGRLAPRLPC